jgi:hypothetical protein
MGLFPYNRCNTNKQILLYSLHFQEAVEGGKFINLRLKLFLGNE